MYQPEPVQSGDALEDSRGRPYRWALPPYTLYCFPGCQDGLEETTKEYLIIVAGLRRYMENPNAQAGAVCFSSQKSDPGRRHLTPA